MLFLHVPNRSGKIHGMSRELLSQIETLEKACHAALRAGDDKETITLLVQTLTTVKFTVSEDERPIVRGLANMASTHSEMLLSALNCGEPRTVVHNGLIRVCHSLEDLRETLQDEPEPNDRAAS